jgi:hypothetical protein
VTRSIRAVCKFASRVLRRVAFAAAIRVVSPGMQKRPAPFEREHPEDREIAPIETAWPTMLPNTSNESV